MPTPERLLETVERYEEDLTDAARPHSPIHAVISVGEAMEGQRPHGIGAPKVTLWRLNSDTGSKLLLEESKTRRRA